ncbi:MAG: Y-family DNA polymerase [Alphaproteobacteria bacterium]
MDFDGFFASVMQQAMPDLRGKPIGVIPFELQGRGLLSTMVIACSKEAKAYGCSNTMRVPEALEKCPDMVLVPQRPDLYRRAHNALLAEIACEIPIETVKSIDELCCKLDTGDIADPHGLAKRLKERLSANIGPYVTCSIGFAANRLLAKMACKQDKPNGVTVWKPEDMPGPLVSLPLSEVSGIGPAMELRLERAGIRQMDQLLATDPKHLRKIWGNVNGERMWYALNGYDVYALPTGRSMYGHGRVLPPKHRTPKDAEAYSRLLLTKATRRMRRDRFYADTLWLWLDMREGDWAGKCALHLVNDDQACLKALKILWNTAKSKHKITSEIVRIGVTLADLQPSSARQLDFFTTSDAERKNWEEITGVMDFLNHKFGKRVLTIGPWLEPPGGFAGGKISYTRIPSAEDFW